MKKNKIIGRKGENIAKDYLQNQGYEVIERNYYTRYGEIDIIAVKNDILYFVEVKTRTTDKFGKGFEAISWFKCEKIKKVADLYIAKISWKNKVQLLAVSIDYQSCNSYNIELMEIF